MPQRTLLNGNAVRTDCSVEATFDPVPGAGQFLIAATTLAAELPLYTRNPDDFAGLDSLLEIMAID
jgi:predicted nucleic acid-binding protein